MAWKDVRKGAPEHYSHTQINMYRRCPKQFEFRYVKGVKQKPTSALVLGVSVHKGIELNYTSKFKRKKSAKLDEVMDAFADQFDESKSGADFEGKKPGMVKDIGYQMSQVHYEKLAPGIEPIALPEREFQVKIPGVSKPVMGFMDVIGMTRAGKTIMDNKTSGRKKTDLEIETDDQLTLYSYAEKQISGEAPKVVGFDVLVNLKDGIMPQRVTTRRGPDRFKALEETIQAVDKGIKAGAFPATSNSQICSWCGYRPICPTAKGFSK